MGCCSVKGNSAALLTASMGAIVILSAGALRASDDAPKSEPIAAQEAAARTPAGIDETIDALYDVISGPAGEKRDWDRFRGLFTESAMMALTAPGPEGRRLMTITPDEYAERFGPQLEQGGFTERETHRVLEVFGTVAHAFSTYDGRLEANADFRVQGINSIQLVRVGADGDEGGPWKVHSILWHQKAPDEEIPARYTARPAEQAEQAEGL